jgi:hypothetical protein
MAGNGHDPTVGRILAKRRAMSPPAPSREQQPFQGEVHVHIHNFVLQFPEGAIQVPAAEVHVEVPPANVEVVKSGDKTVNFMRDEQGRISAATVKEQSH